MNENTTNIIRKHIDAKYHNGFYFSKSKNIVGVTSWVKYSVEEFWLHSDPRNKFDFRGDSSSFVAILGNVFDVTSINDTRTFIHNRLLELLRTSESKFFDLLDDLNGRFVIFYKEHSTSGVKVLNDACGMGSVFYINKPGINLASHPNLLASQVGAKINSNNTFLSKYSGYHLPGNITMWDDVYQLIPNHYYDSFNGKLRRYFPRKELPKCENVENTRKELAHQLNTQVTKLNKSHNLLCSISAGIDSRVTLSATKSCCKDILYFTYTGGSGESRNILSIDEKVVTDIVNNLNLNHHFFEINTHTNTNIDSLQKRLCFENYLVHNPSATFEYINRFTEKKYLHIRSNLLEIGRRFYRSTYSLENKIFDLETVITCYSPKAIGDLSVRNIFSSFLAEINYDNLPKGYDPFDLFYWEYRMGIWHSMILRETDAAFDTYILFNSRNFLKSLLSIPEDYRRDNRFYLSLCEDNWPILNYWSINSELTLGSTFDHEVHNSSSAISLQTAVIISGSSEPDLHPEYISLIKSHSSRFNMTASGPKKGDYVSMKISVDTKKTTGKKIVINFRTPYGGNKKFPGRIESQIIINGSAIFTKDISEWRETNQIVFTPDIGETETIDIEIKSISLVNCENWSWGKAGTTVVERISII